ncbi:MAG: molecular chaperone TorD family protein [Gammaproteobacteria bacterium]|nr:molecular chaperone TorD family protein [Gammaproteobacteria bacterium]
MPPYASVQLEEGRGNLWGEATAWVQAYFDRAGFRLPDGSGGIPDHFSLELLFLQHLTASEAGALERGAEEEAAALREVRQYFLQQHLLRWAEPFLERVEAAAEADFYPTFCALARRLLESEAEYIAGAASRSPW